MNRTWLSALFIVLIAALAAYANLDLFVPGYEHPTSVTRWLFTQPQREPQERTLALRQGLDLQGGLQVLLEARPEKGETVSMEDLETARQIIINRIDPFGVTEPVVQTQGNDKIVVELPGIEDPEMVVRTIGETARLEFVYAAQNSLTDGQEILSTYPILYREIKEAVEDEEDGLDVDPGRLRPFLGDPSDPIPELAAEQEGEATDSGTDGEESGETAAPTEDDAAEAEDSDGDGTAGSDTGDAAAEDTEEDAGSGADEAAEDATDDAADTEGDAAADVGDADATETAADEGEGESGDGDGEAAEDEEGRLETIYPTVIDGDFVQAAGVGVDSLTSAIAVSFQLTPEGGRRMREFSQDHVGEIMAIILDGKVISAPVLRDAIGSDGQITGTFTQAEAEALAIQIESGALPVSLELVGQTRIGPTLGAEAIQAAINGGLIGLIVVMIFMLLYYRLPGLLADFALLLYALLTLALFRMFNFTLTLAGIAGFILSIGMAVDANILIFERMKEELRAGRRVRRAMEIGFQRAWPSIRDSNISTIITSFILIWFGSQFGASIVKGFAITLMLGVATSLFTAITVTRTLLKVSNKLVLRETEDGARATESSRLRALFGF